MGGGGGGAFNATYKVMSCLGMRTRTKNKFVTHVIMMSYYACEGETRLKVWRQWLNKAIAEVKNIIQGVDNTNNAG